MTKQTIPHDTWTKVLGTDWEIRQSCGTSVPLEVDDAGHITIHADGPVTMRQFMNSGPALDTDHGATAEIPKTHSSDGSRCGPTLRDISEQYDTVGDMAAREPGTLADIADAVIPSGHGCAHKENETGQGR